MRLFDRAVLMAALAIMTGSIATGCDAFNGSANHPNWDSLCSDQEQHCRDWRDDAGTVHAGGCCPIDGFLCWQSGQCRFIGVGTSRDGGADAQ